LAADVVEMRVKMAAGHPNPTDRFDLKHDAGVEKSLWVGTGAALGKVGGMVAKFTCGLLMLAAAWFTW
jgi:hypothetical protein